MLFRKEIESVFESPDPGQIPDVRTSELRSALWGSDRSPVDRVLALEALSRRDPALARNLAGSSLDGPGRGSIYRAAVLLGQTAFILNDCLKGFEGAGGEVGFRSPAARQGAQEITELITALETARFLVFRAACLTDTAAADVEAAKCEKLAVEIAERAALAERNERLREGERA